MTDSLDGRIVVFAGPSLPTTLRPSDPEFAWLPPAAAGDVVRLGDAAPKAVVLIDGLFDATPAVRHKELVNLMASGVPLIGGASMGALRAAELHGLGMIGVGRIFHAFLGGRLVGDDEVALMHGPADWEWTPVTEALVNVRATLVAAARARVIDVDAARDVLGVARGIFYKERTWPGLLRDLATAGPDRAAVSDALAEWLPIGRVDLKQRDALACLDVARVVETWMPRPAISRSDTVFSRALADQVAKTARGE